MTHAFRTDGTNHVRGSYPVWQKLCLHQTHMMWRLLWGCMASSLSHVGHGMTNERWLLPRPMRSGELVFPASGEVVRGK